MGTILKIIGIVLAVMFFPYIAVPVIAIYLIIKYGVKALKLVVFIVVLGVVSHFLKVGGAVIGLVLLLAGMVILVLAVRYMILKARGKI